MSRFITVAVFLMVFQGIGGIIFANSGLMGFDIELHTTEVSASDISAYNNATAGYRNDAQAQSTDPLSTALGWFYTTLFNMAASIINAVPLFKAVVWLPIVMSQAGIPGPLCIFIGILRTIIEGIGMFELFRGGEII